jgi:MFS family permease
MKQRNLVASIFLIAFAFGLNITGITPILGILNTLYGERETAEIQLLQTMPYALLMIGSLLVGRLVTLWSKKRIASAGLLIIGICGVLPFFHEGYYLLFVSRLLIGFGFGITAPMNTAMIAEFFQPKERAGYMGLHVVGMGAGTITGNFFGGMLASLGYRYFYLVYLTAFISMLAIQILLPNMTPVIATTKAGMRLNKTVYLISIAFFVHTLFITTYGTNIAIYMMESITQNTAMAGIATAVNAAFALLVGAAFAKISKALKQYTLPASIFAAAIGYVAILIVPGMAGVFIGSACCGISLSCFMAQGSFLISVSVEPEAVAKASGLSSVVGGVGGLVSPILLETLSSRVFGNSTTGYRFLLSCIGMATLTLAALLIMTKRSGQEGA